jgi:hypothetical protein
VTSLEHHLLSHEGDMNGGAQADLSTIYSWYADRFAYFLDLLDGLPEGDGTVLDNSIVVWGSELGKGNTHSFENVPFVVAGGAGGRLAGGRYLEYDTVDHNRLLVSICHLMGYEDVESFGATDVGSGPLAGLV